MWYMTMTAFSSAAAILMLTLAPADQALAPLALSLLLLFYATPTHLAAGKAGLLAGNKSVPESGVENEAASQNQV